MRVLFLSLWYPNAQNPVSGTFVADQARALRAQGVEVRVVQPIPATPFPIPLLKPSYRQLAALPAEERHLDHAVYHPRYIALPGHRLYEHVGDALFRAVRGTVARIHREWAFDVIHAHATYPCGHAANRCRDELLPRIKVLHTIHRTCIVDAPNYNRACFERVRAALESADANVFVSREGLRLGLTYTDQRIAARSEYLTNGVDTTAFALDAAEQAEVTGMKSLYAESFNVVFVGYLKEVKGVKELLEAVRLLVLEGRRNLRLFLVGADMLGSYVDDFVAAHGLRGIVARTGSVPHQKVKLWMNFADAFVLPSHSEGTPTVLFEALYCGAPSIFTSVGGVEDVVTDGSEALVIPPRSVSAIGAAIARLMDDAPLRAALSRRGHALIAGRYTWESNARAIAGIYARLIGDRPA